MRTWTSPQEMACFYRRSQRRPAEKKEEKITRSSLSIKGKRRKITDRSAEKKKGGGEGGKDLFVMGSKGEKEGRPPRLGKLECLVDGSKGGRAGLRRGGGEENGGAMKRNKDPMGANGAKGRERTVTANERVPAS